MVHRVPAVFRSRVLGQAAIVALLSGVSAGCTMERFNTPLFTGATSGQRTAAAPGQPMPPELVGDADTGGTIGLGQSPSITTAELPPPPADERDFATRETTTAWNESGDTAIVETRPAAPSGATITVESGDTLYSLSRRSGLPVSAIAAANGLTTDSRLRIGQKLILPGADFPTAGRGEPPRSLGVLPEREAPRGETRVAAAAPAAAPAGEHVVKLGETLYSIALAYRVTPNALAEANGMSQPEHLRVGQRLVVPGGRRPAETRVAALQTEPGRTVTDAAPTDPGGTPAAGQPTEVARLTPPQERTETQPAAPARTETPQAPAAEQAAVQPTAPAVADEPSADGTSFRWPVRGRIISGFGAKPGGERNDGINLAVPEGTSVKAAEGGTVIYSGNEIAGYGNLLLIRHTGGWVTAYAHTSEILVQRGDKVERGQIVAKAGATGAVTSPQLHFELRRGQTPVNPLDYLSGT